ncbi:aminotransferase class III-fold pyridoxal phosphate-dependent enzyme [Kitasatospora sp. NBC_00315]|uniref:aminotransferase class III-fold pyridoxal phosphate-dependent enzyme n=1 Tax=Kitasatospora sp. NBC_00315 TaxID=2975963 RepID=UPI00324FB69E
MTTTPLAPSPRPATRSLSALDEGAALDVRYTLEGSENATLHLRGEDGTVLSCTDLMSAYASVNFGHRNPELEPVLAGGSDLAALFYPPQAELLAGWLCDRLGLGADGRVLFQVGGSFAVSSALALARRARPGRVLAIRGAFHGLGVDALAVTTVQRSSALQDTGFADRIADQVTHLEPGEVPEDWDDVSCVLYETVQGANGYLPLDVEWLAELQAAARRAGALTIADEIQGGYYRHGHLSPAVAAGLDPDILLFGKSLTNGLFPLSAVVYRSRLEADAGATVHLAHTFQTATLGFAAGWEVARYLDRSPVDDWCERVAAALGRAARRWADAGLITAVRLTGPTLSFEPAGPGAADVVRGAFRRGVLVFAGGEDGRRIRIAPPLTIPGAELEAALDAVTAALTEDRPTRPLGDHHGS